MSYYPLLMQNDTFYLELQNEIDKYAAKSKNVLLFGDFNSRVGINCDFVMSLCASVYMCFVVTCWERADLLDIPLVSWVRCGT